MSSIEIKFYETVEKVNAFLAKEIFNKPIRDWLLIAIKYSFVLWLSIMAYTAVFYYKKISKVNKEIENKIKILENKKLQKRKLLIKLKEINKTYRLAYKYFNKRKLNSLQKKINTFYNEKILNKTSPFIVSPIKLESFNYKINVSRDLFQKFQTITLEEFRFSSLISKYFTNFLLKNADKNINTQKVVTKTLSVSLTRQNSNTFILVARKNIRGPLELHLSVNYPFIKDIYKTGYIATTFLSFDALRNQNTYSPLLIKWQFTIKGETK